MGLPASGSLRLRYSAIFFVIASDSSEEPFRMQPDRVTRGAIAAVARRSRRFDTVTDETGI